ncbi:hypothetical protein KAI87_06915 [Myxococcota bacterium]|nr:hypothetical protein [Myxococcota bacterium]
MTIKRQFKLRLLEHDNRLFHLLLLVLLGSAVAALATSEWLNHSTEISDTDSENPTAYERLLSHIPHWDKKSMKKTQKEGPALGRLLAAAKKGELPAHLVVDAWLEQEASHWNLSEDELRSRFEEQVEEAKEHPAVVVSESPVARLGALKHALVTEHPIVYNREAVTLGHILIEQRLQCSSGSLNVILAWLAIREEHEEDKIPIPVMIHTSGHVQPGLISDGHLFVAESTTRDKKVTQLAPDEVKNMRVVDAISELAVILLGKNAPRWIHDGAVLIDAASTEEDIAKTSETEPEKEKTMLDTSPFGFGIVKVPKGDFRMAERTGTPPGRTFAFTLMMPNVEAEKKPNNKTSKNTQDNISNENPTSHKRLKAKRFVLASSEEVPIQQNQRGLKAKLDNLGFAEWSQLQFDHEGRCLMVVDPSICQSSEPESCSAILFVRKGSRWRRHSQTTVGQIKIPSACPRFFRPPWELRPIKWLFREKEVTREEVRDYWSSE